MLINKSDNITHHRLQNNEHMCIVMRVHRFTGITQVPWTVATSEPFSLDRGHTTIAKSRRMHQIRQICCWGVKQMSRSGGELVPLGSLLWGTFAGGPAGILYLRSKAILDHDELTISCIQWGYYGVQLLHGAMYGSGKLDKYVHWIMHQVRSLLARRAL
jgi:hypothetical protein